MVEAPGLGDDIQAIKAGILEIADILVINKADRPGVETTERALRGMLQLAHPTPHIFHHSDPKGFKNPSGLGQGLQDPSGLDQIGSHPSSAPWRRKARASPN